jgi:hypothetical protein
LQDDDPHIFMGQAHLKKGSNGRHVPLRLIAGGRDGQINRSVDQADTGAARGYDLSASADSTRPFA